jgi:curved DNA-binding protein CbpA
MEMRMPQDALADLRTLQAAATGNTQAGSEYSATSLTERIRAASTACGRHTTPNPEMYAVLGLAAPPPHQAGRFGGETNAEAQERSADVKKAFRRVALRLHPDKVASVLPAGAFDGLEAKLLADTERLFRVATDAAAALGDTDARDTYHANERRHSGTGADGGASWGRNSGGRGGFRGGSRASRGGFQGSHNTYWRNMYTEFGGGSSEGEEEEEDVWEENHGAQAEAEARLREAAALAALRRAEELYEAAKRAREALQRQQRASPGYSPGGARGPRDHRWGGGYY